MAALREHTEVVGGREQFSEDLSRAAPVNGEAAPEMPVAEIKEKTGASELMAAVERFLAATGDESRPAFRNLQAQMKLAKEAGQIDELVRAMRLALTPTLDFTSAQALLRL